VGHDVRPRYIAHIEPAHCHWLRLGIVDEEQVHKTLRRMARIVDRQNAGVILSAYGAAWRSRLPAHRRREVFFARSSSDVGETHVIERTLYAGGAP
jgi:malate synthase